MSEGCTVLQYVQSVFLRPRSALKILMGETEVTNL